ncbi:guanine nucleotide binding protein, alpha subunit [Mycena sp. CBHHK59/15]|nr:guanine nucleotide binding protein, alpha subunit [Mycena sp. CBHHK59/15]
MLPPRRNVWPPPPPAAETDEEKHARVEAEREAKRVSNAIDEALATEREQRKRPSNAKILLLGQAESGKSTILKNLQLHFAPKAFQAEAEAWRPVIHLNLVRSVNFVLGLLEIRHPSTYTHSTAPPDSGALSGELRRLSISLAPLRQVEESLSARIAGAHPLEEGSDATRYNPAKASEISVRSGSGWTAFLRFRRGSSAEYDRNERADEMQARRILSACAADIVTLWGTSEVQQGLKDREITLQEQSGFFLDDVIRICQEDYTPTPDDILRARVHTVGPEEHVINMESNSENVKSWTVYDMGGSTSQRAAWAQFFDDVHVIIFLAPISAFNETLAENRSVNRLADSLKLWRTICANKLLIAVEFILFLNKVDILTRKIESGVRFAEHVTSFRNKPNEPKEVIKLLTAHMHTDLSDAFATINQTYSPRRRKMHRHVTCAIDTKATSVVIDNIREVILFNALTSNNIL